MLVFIFYWYRWFFIWVRFVLFSRFTVELVCFYWNEIVFWKIKKNNFRFVFLTLFSLTHSTLSLISVREQEWKERERYILYNREQTYFVFLGYSIKLPSANYVNYFNYFFKCSLKHVLRNSLIYACLRKLK